MLSPIESKNRFTEILNRAFSKLIMNQEEILKSNRQISQLEKNLTNIEDILETNLPIDNKNREFDKRNINLFVSTLKEITFGDKIVLMHSGEWITSLVIVSEINLITKNMVSFLTKQFENEFYGKRIEIDSSVSIDVGQFSTFDKTVNLVRSYMPL